MLYISIIYLMFLISNYDQLIVLLNSHHLICDISPTVVGLVVQCYIVYLGAHSHGPHPTSAELEIATNSHYDLLSSTLGRYTMHHIYESLVFEFFLSVWL
jgi:hypothetical protein